MSIFVERVIHAEKDRIWALTQTPDLHARWDLRFSSIRYLPRQRTTDPQSFEYETRLGFGLAIRGTGETAGEHRADDGTSSSSLVFGSADKLSLIRKGNGYWRYAPEIQGRTRFATAYDYAVRWGAFGWLLDRILFRPLMAWATAWSFDRLARWATRGTAPETSLRISLAYTIARLTLAAMWLYEGVVPKLFGPHPQELAMSARLVSAAWAGHLVVAMGIAEVALGLLLLLLWQRRWPLVLTAAAMVPALLVGAYAAPQLIAATFNMVVLSTMTAALALVALALQPDVVSASACQWRAYRKSPLTRLFGH